jgi:SAM-dependent methyltransferase
MINENVEIDSRVQREQEFHDQRFSNLSTREKKVGRFYQITQSVTQYYESFLQENCQDAIVIEYGCGLWNYASYLSKNNAKNVIGIDISSVAIDMARQQVQEEGMGDNISFQVMNAEDLKFDESSIDLICGAGILHHLNMERAMKSIVKVLVPKGKAIFVEPLGHNLLINLFRYLTPDVRSEDERPLLDKDLKMLEKYFRKVEIEYFYFTALIASFFVGFPGFNLLLKILEFIDKQLFKVPLLQKQAWVIVIKVSEPIG